MSWYLYSLWCRNLKQWTTGHHFRLVSDTHGRSVMSWYLYSFWCRDLKQWIAGHHVRLVSDTHGPSVMSWYLYSLWCRDLKHWRAGHHVRLVSDTHGQLVISLQSHRIQTRQASGLYGALTGIRTWDLRARFHQLSHQSSSIYRSDTLPTRSRIIEKYDCSLHGLVYQFVQLKSSNDPSLSQSMRLSSPH